MNLAGVVQQLRKERDQAARTVERLDAALAALDAKAPLRVELIDRERTVVQAYVVFVAANLLRAGGNDLVLLREIGLLLAFGATQAAMMTYMPLIFVFMFSAFPVGLVIYYTWSNILTLLQQYVMMRRHGVEVHLFNNLKLPWARSPAQTPGE